MKTKITLLLFTIIFSFHVNAQWVACNNGLDNYVWGSCVYNGNLYACGNFENADSNPALGIAKWNGTGWSDVGGGFNHGAFSNVVRGLVVYNGELIAGGYVDSAGGNPIHKVAKWNGTSWSAMGTDCPISTINCFAVHNGELYAGGQPGGTVKVAVAKWTGTNWVGIDLEGSDINVWAMVSYNGKLYAGGGFSNFNGGTAAGIAEWNGTTWNSINTGFGLFDAVRALAVYNNKLFIGGSFATIGGTPANNIASWDGSNYAALAGGTNAQVQSLYSNGTKLFVGGTFWMVNSTTTNANRAAYWDGSAWTVLGTDLGSGAKTICIYNNELYYGGEGAFNGQHYFAKWSGGNFPDGINENREQIQFSVFPNPVSEKLFVHSKSVLKNLFVTDITGRRLNIAISSSPKSSEEFVVDISNLTEGIYFLSSEKNSAAARFVVQH